jgi:putative membrane-bound dehydrogenase-like protein
VVLFWSPVRGQVGPEESAAKLKPAAGLEAKLWASEPMLMNPTTIDIDSRGRVWVTEGLNYRLTRGGNAHFQRIEGADRIKILEDTDQDGKADRMTVFADNIFPVPMGIAIEEHWSVDGKYLGARVFVGNSPHLLVLEDTDGDDRADKRYPLLSGFGGIDSDHGVHGMTLGLDGKLYFTHGDGCCSVQPDKSERTQNFDVTDASGRRVATDQLGTVLRCDRDGTNLEVLATRLRNDYECALDSFGNVFASDNDDDGNRGSRVVWIMDGGVYGYRTPGSPRHWGEDAPGNVPKLAGTGNGSPCGVMVYEGQQLPPRFQGALLEAEAGPRAIYAFPLKRVGAAFRTKPEVLLSSEDGWFRPVDVCAAPDGSLFIADWYDGGVGGHAFRDQTTGRIYRVAAEGAASRKVEYDFATVAGLRDALKSPNIAARDVARRLLIARGPDDQVAQRAMALVRQQADPRDRARAAWVEAQIDRAGTFTALERAMQERGRALTETPAELREQAVRILGRDNSRLMVVQDPKPGPPRAERHLDAILAAAGDPDPGVRREVILVLRNVPTGKAGAALRLLAATWDGQDRWYLEALGLALRHREPDYIATLFDGTLYGDLSLNGDGRNGRVALPPYYPVDRNEAFLSVDDHVPPATPLSKTLGLMWGLGRYEAMPLLAKLYPEIAAPELRQAVEDVLAQIVDPRGALTLAELVRKTDDPARKIALLGTLARRLESAWRSVAGDEAIQTVIREALDDPKTRGTGIDLAVLDAGGSLIDRVAGWVDDQSQSEETRGRALEAIAKARHPRAREMVERAIQTARETGSSSELAVSAVRAVPRLGADGDALLEDLMLAEGVPLGLRREALRAFAMRPENARALLAWARDRKLPDSLKLDASTVLRAHPDAGIRGEVDRVLPITSADGKPLPSVGELVRRDGDAGRGRDVFFRSGTNACGSCHRVQGQGQWVGPDLSTIGAKYGKRELLEAILNPSAAIAYNFRSVVVATADGRVLTGLPIEELATHLTIKTADGQRIKLSPAEIDTRKTAEISLMPEGLVQTLSEQDLVDLLAFLATLKQPVSIAGEALVSGPFPTADLPPVPTEWRRVTADAEGRLPLVSVDPTPNGHRYDAVQFSIHSSVPQPARLVVDSSVPEVVAYMDGIKFELARGSSPASAFQSAIQLPATSVTMTFVFRADRENHPVVTIISDQPVSYQRRGAEGAER